MKKQLLLATCILIQNLISSPYEETMVNSLPMLDATTRQYLKDQCNSKEKPLPFPRKITGDALLFSYFPGLKGNLSYVSLGSFPTPVEQTPELARELSIKQLYIKRDGLSGAVLPTGKRLFGGNKVRKLEWLLADAQEQEISHVITFGCLGSNHGTATCVYGNLLGLHVSAMLKNQPITDVVKQNLCIDFEANATLCHWASNHQRAIGTAYKFLRSKQLYGTYPYFIPTGGSNVLGAVGFVQAAFELKEQIDAGIMPKPDYMYVALGSGGTLAGLILGCKAAQLDIQIIPIAVEHERTLHEMADAAAKLANETSIFLHDLDNTFPLIQLEQENFMPNFHFVGKSYGVGTPEGQEAQELFMHFTGIPLDPTYTAKAASGLVADARAGKLKNSVVLFWNTFDESEKEISEETLQKLPYSIRAKLGIAY